MPPSSRGGASRTPHERAALALVAADLGEPGAWRLLDGPALEALLADVAVLAATVPHALALLARQLAEHPDPGLRQQATRILVPVSRAYPDGASELLWQLANDPSAKVRRAAAAALVQIGEEVPPA